MPKPPSLDIAAGDLCHRIELRMPNPKRDASGGPLPDVTVGETWAAIETTYGQNLYQEQFVSLATHVVTIRYRGGVTPQMRIGFHGRTFNILYVDNVQERNVRLNLICQEVL